jgi:molecular chaperone DnaK
MCGGRDFDRELLHGVVKPWLLEQFNLPDDFDSRAQFKTLISMAAWASERAKIELSQREEAVISLPETELGIRDLSGADIYLDIAISRRQFNRLVEVKIQESIRSAQETLAKAGLEPKDVERIVFVGGPTHYKPLRDRVASALGIAPSIDVNPMTAVAEGAAVFAESIDWSSQSRGRKNARGNVTTGGPLGLSLNFLSRTPESKTRIVVKLAGSYVSGAELQVDSLDTGWSSGRVPLRDGTTIEVVLSKPGANSFKVFVFDTAGGPIALTPDKMVITRTAASIDAIPASHSIGVEVRQRVGGRTVLDFLVREGDHLPKKGKRTFKAVESLKAGSAGSLKFKLWEGDVADPPADNRFIGMFEVRGMDFDEGVIPAGADLICDYEVRDSGNIHLEVTIPSIGGSFRSGHNYYSRQEGQIDYSKAAQLIGEQADQAAERLDEMASKIEDPLLEQARERLQRASTLRPGEADPERAKQALDDVQDAKRLLAEARKEHLKVIRQLELEKTIALFDSYVRQYARASEVLGFENLSKTAQRAIDSNSPEFEVHLDELRGNNFTILWRQDWFVIDRFKDLAQNGHRFPDARHHAELVGAGIEALNANDIERLRQVVFQLDSSKVSSTGDNEVVTGANIILG